MTKPPTIDELPQEDQYAIATGTITKVEQIGDTWVDDHIVCAAVRVHTVAGFTFDVSLLWCGSEIVGAIKYSSESPTALADVIAALLSGLD